MCGIYGAFGPGIIREDLNVVSTLAFLNMQRGMHSTGVAQIWYDKSRAPKITKDVVPALTFFNKEENKKLLSDSTVYALMCHNRYATVGKHDNIAGAHPFETERYVGFHNGTLRERDYAEHPDYFTDSEALWNDIDVRGFENVLAPLYEESAFALAYYDKVDHQIGFIRNSKRPLAFACNQQRSVVYYSSDIEDLKYALNRHKVDAHFYSLGTWSLISCDPRSFNFSPPEKNKKRTNYWFIKEIKPRPEKPPVTRYSSNYSCSPVSNSTKGWSSSRGSVIPGGDCKICSDSLYNKKSIRVPGFGRICESCDEILFMNYQIDAEDEFECHVVSYYADNVLDDRNQERKQQQQVLVN